MRMKDSNTLAVSVC